jgi:hypothetical protein
VIAQDANEFKAKNCDFSSFGREFDIILLQARAANRRNTYANADIDTEPNPNIHNHVHFDQDIPPCFHPHLILYTDAYLRPNLIHGLVRI